MRYLLFTILGFFGPALIMLFLRLLWFRVQAWWMQKRNQPEIIDVTPNPSKYPSRLFIFTWIGISVICTGLLIWQLDDSPAKEQIYIPAHIDTEGNFVPAQTLEVEE